MFAAGSFERLPTQERVLWQRVSVFPGSFDLDGALAVTAGEPVPANTLLDVLDELVSKSILNREPTASGPSALLVTFLTPPSRCHSGICST